MELIEWPFCTGEVPAHARKCKHCGEWLKETQPISSRQATPTIDIATHTMSSADLVKHFVPRLESILKDKLGAEGTGLIEQMNNVSHLLSGELQEAIRQIGRIPNRVFHE